MLWEISNKKFSQVGVDETRDFNETDMVRNIIGYFCKLLDCTDIFVSGNIKNRYVHKFFRAKSNILLMPKRALADMFDTHIPDNNFSHLLREKIE